MSRLPLSVRLFAALAAFALVAAQPAALHASTWKQLSPAASPAARFYPAMAYAREQEDRPVRRLWR